MRTSVRISSSPIAVSKRSTKKSSAATVRVPPDPAITNSAPRQSTGAPRSPDLGAPVLCLGAEFVIAGSGGTRTVEADDFFVDLFETAIGEDEILTEVRIPKHTGWGAHYEKFVRVAHQWPIVAVAATVRGSIDEAKIGLTNMGSTPLRARATEAALAGASATEDGVRAAAEQAAEGTNPPSDLNGAADYRQHLARVLTGRAVLKA